MAPSFFCPNHACPGRNRRIGYSTERGLKQHLNQSAQCRDHHAEANITTRRCGVIENINLQNAVSSPQAPYEQEDTFQDEICSTGNDVPSYPDDKGDDVFPVDADPFFPVEAVPTTPTTMGDPIVCFDRNNPSTFTEVVDHPPQIFDLSDAGDKCPREWVQSWIDWSEAESLCHPIEKKDNLDLLSKLLIDPSYLPGWQIISRTEIAEITLMSILQEIPNCPLDTYQKVVNWNKMYFRTVSWEGDGVSDSGMTSLRSRDVVLKSAIADAAMEDSRPINTRLHLNGCQQKVDITHIPYTAALYSLLVSPEVVNDDTLLFNGPTPYDNPPEIPSEIFDDYDTGSRYREAWVELKVKEIDFPLPEVLFIDKSVHDKNDRLTGEPVNYQFGLVKRAARNRPVSWRSLGSLPSFKNLGHADNTCHKMADYHQCLEFILSGMKTEQLVTRGILWPLLYRGTLYMVRFKPYILTVLGDTPGQNVLAGKTAGPNSDRICRYCDVAKHDLSNPYAEYRLVTKDVVKHIRSDDKLLKAYGYKNVDSAFNALRFGEVEVDSRGIHANVPAEILHTIQKGLLKRSIDCCLTTKCLNAADKKDQTKESRASGKADRKKGKDTKKRKLTKRENKMAAGPKKNRETGELAKVRKNDGSTYLFGGRRGRQMNAVSLQLGKWLSHQSERDIPRVTFTKGILNTSKLTASEHQGISLLILLILVSTWALEPAFDLRNSMGDETLGGYVQLLEGLMCFEELLKSHPGKTSKPLRRSDLPIVDFYIRVILGKIKDTTNRTEGDGWNIIKFHLTLHMVSEDFVKYGVPGNTSGGPGECQFKENFHVMASTTQKRAGTFDQQYSERRHQRDSVNRRMEVLESAGIVGNGLHSLRNRNPLCTNQHHHLLLGSGVSHEVPSYIGEAYANSFLNDGTGRESNNDVEEDSTDNVPNDRLRSKETVNLSRDVSAGIYKMLWVTDVSPSSRTSRQRIEIVYCGDKTTRLYQLLFKHDGLDHQFVSCCEGKPVGVRGCIGLSGYNPEFTELQSYFSPMFVHDESLQLTIFTTLKVTAETIVDTYRADPLSHIDMNPRNDWAIFQWSGADGLVPGQIRAFFYLTAEHIDNFNSSIAETSNATYGVAIEPVSEPGRYALIHSLRKAIPGLLDPKVMDLDPENSIMQANSMLFFYEEKEMSPTKTQPLGRLVDCGAIERPVVVIPDFSPIFDDNDKSAIVTQWIRDNERKHSYIIMRPRSTWHEVFINKAKHEKKVFIQKDREEAKLAALENRQPEEKLLVRIPKVANLNIQQTKTIRIAYLLAEEGKKKAAEDRKKAKDSEAKKKQEESGIEDEEEQESQENDDGDTVEGESSCDDDVFEDSSDDDNEDEED